MTEATKKPETPEGGTVNKIEAYLQGPRKKRKNYIILALGDSFDRDLSTAMESYIKKNYAQFAFSTPKTPEELSRQFGRNISLLIVNDLFTDQKNLMNLVRTLKERRRNETIPVLFLTRDGEKLVNLYHDELFLYHESDDYVAYNHVTLPSLFSRIKSGIETQNRRKSRRYPVNIEVTFYHLNKDAVLDGAIVDLSMHGAVLSSGKDMIFRIGDQVKLNIPVTQFLDTGSTGDFIRISGRIRRVFISGNRVALSFEHVTQQQSKSIGELILSLVGQHFVRQTNRMRGSLGPLGGNSGSNAPKKR
jgi:hypothetical protein